MICYLACTCERNVIYVLFIAGELIPLGVDLQKEIDIRFKTQLVNVLKQNWNDNIEFNISFSYCFLSIFFHMCMTVYMPCMLVGYGHQSIRALKEVYLHTFTVYGNVLFHSSTQCTCNTLCSGRN